MGPCVCFFSHQPFYSFFFSKHHLSKDAGLRFNYYYTRDVCYVVYGWSRRYEVEIAGIKIKIRNLSPLENVSILTASWVSNVLTGLPQSLANVERQRCSAVVN